MDWNSYPRAASGLEINPVDDGYVIYDAGLDKVHYLNHTAVLVFELCTGQIKASELPELVQAAYELPEPPVEEVERYLDTLFQEGLLH